MDIKEAYQVMAKESGIKIGDTVKVLRKAQSEEMGWTGCWQPGMDDTIGNEYTVSYIDDGHYQLDDGWWLPFFVLEKIKSVKFVYKFQPFDKVLVRDGHEDTWKVDLFSHFKEMHDYKYKCIGNHWKQCVPYEGNEHLLGTTDSPE